MTDELIVKNYEMFMGSRVQHLYYGNSGFFNYGYWDDTTKTQAQASAKLVQKLIDILPEPKGRVLDVACGLGATTRYLADQFGPEQVTGVNISPNQLAAAQTRSASQFALMDAVNLTFAPNSFDVVFCVEAAFHFQTREAFLYEAKRILKPGGWLVLTDILLNSTRRNPYVVMPIENHIESIPEYRQQLQSCGFTNLIVDDITASSINEFGSAVMAWPDAQRQAGNLDFRAYIEARILARVTSRVVRRQYAAYLLVGMQKPL